MMLHIKWNLDLCWSPNDDFSKEKMLYAAAEEGSQGLRLESIE